MTTIHLPDNWTMKFDEFGGYDCMTAAYEIYKNGEHVCSIDAGYYPPRVPFNKIEKELAEEIAAFIVTACNSHADLLAALKDVMEWIKNWGPEFTDDEEWGETETNARAAIEGAKP